MLSNSGAEYEAVTTEMALSLRELATSNQNRPQQAGAPSGETLQKLL
jgi:hypothetical protein